MEVSFEPERGGLLYESVVEEVALEGLDGICLQALFDRLVDREGSPPISKDETDGVLASIWEATRRDLRLRFYLLPQRRPALRIWNRFLHHDARGNVEEPNDAPEEIYGYKSVELQGPPLVKERKQREKPTRLTVGQLDRLCFKSPKTKPGQGQGEFSLGGISFRKKQGDNLANVPSGRKKLQRAVRKNEDLENPEIVSVRGSCPSYESRKDITYFIRYANMDYSRAKMILGQRLVIVASQNLRETLLFQNANQTDLNDVQYMIVERVGRARQYGEQARGKISLATTGVDPKTQFYMRKVLLAEGIISKQPLIMRFGESKTGTLISVFHLPHFFRRQENPESIKIRKIFAYICNAAGNRVDYFKVQNIFGKHLMRALVNQYADFVKVDEVPFPLMHPGDFAKETAPAKKEQLSKRKIRVLCLQRENLTLTDLIQHQLRKQEDANEEEETDGPLPDGKGSASGEGANEDSEDFTFDWSFCYAPGRELAHTSELTQLLRLVISRGRLGVLQQDLIPEMSITSLDARSAVRYLTRWKIANMITEDFGKTKANRWIYFKCERPPKPDPIETNLALDALMSVSDDEENEVIIPETVTEGMKKQPSTKPFIWRSSKLSTPLIDPGSSKQPLQVDDDFGQIRRLSNREFESPTKDPLHIEEKVPESPLTALRKRTAVDPIEISLLSQSSKPKRKRNLFVDSIDLEASKHRENQRTYWNAEEDRTLLYLFIASILFIPRYNVNKIFVYNAIQLRNVLHKRLPTSRSKTTSAIRRRVHSLLKSQTLFTRYRTMLDIAIRDEELYVSFVEKHLPPPSMTVFHPVPQSALEAVTEYLFQKFGPNNKNKPLEELGSPADLQKMLDARELRRMEGIWVDMWGNVLYHFYRRKKTFVSVVPMRQEAIKELESEGLVVEEQGPSWTMPYVEEKEEERPKAEESPCIYTDDQMEFLYDVAVTLLGNADKVISDDAPPSSSDDEEDEPGSINKISKKLKGRGGYPSQLFSGERAISSKYEIFGWTCRTAFMSVLLGGGGPTEKLKEFMSFIPSTMLDRVVQGLRSHSIFTVLKSNRRLILTNQMKRKLTNYIHPNAFRTAHSLLSSLKDNKSVSLSPFLHIGGGFLLAELGPLLNINCKLPASIITVKEDWREEYETIMAAQPQGTEREEVGLRLLRFKINADSEKEKLVEKDFFDINLPTIEVTSKNPSDLINKVIFRGTEDTNSSSEKTYLQSKLIQYVDTEKVPVNFEKKRFSGLFNVIDIAGEAGLSLPFLLRHWKRQELRTGLTYLVDKNFVYMVGVRHRKFVATNHMKGWSFETVSKETAESKRVVARVWVDSYGDINWKLIDRIIVGVLGLLHRSGQLYIPKLAKAFLPLVSYVEVSVVISLLLDLKIISMFKATHQSRNRRFNLFSKWMASEEENDDFEAPYKDYQVDPLLDMDDSWVELMPFDMSKYSRLQAIIFPDESDVDWKVGMESNVFDVEEVEMIGTGTSNDKGVEVEVENEEEQDEDFIPFTD